MITRRHFMKMSAMSAVAAFSGCATDAVTGKRRLMLITENYEKEIDRQSAPHQFSADYGAIRDTALNGYISEIGHGIAAESHRPDMPYSFRGVNAVYVNAYTFPAGSIAITRGMLLCMNSESELAAVLGHETGHVAARHVGKQMTKGIFFQSAALLAAAVIAQQREEYTDLAAGLGMIASGVFLARYSRANEYEADSLGLKYAVGAGHNPDGCVDLMDTLVKLSGQNPNVIEMLFATHPMSSKRYAAMTKAVQTGYAEQRKIPMGRERYMDLTAGVRQQKSTIENLQNGERALANNSVNDALSFFKTALKATPDDYTGLLLAAKCNAFQKKHTEAERYAAEAKAVYPGEPQAVFVEAICMMRNGKYDPAYTGFETYDGMLGGNPNIIFFKGYCREGVGRRKEAADFYVNYLRQVNEGENAVYAYRKLVEWGYIEQKSGVHNAGKAGIS